MLHTYRPSRLDGKLNLSASSSTLSKVLHTGRPKEWLSRMSSQLGLIGDSPTTSNMMEMRQWRDYWIRTSGTEGRFWRLGNCISVITVFQKLVSAEEILRMTKNATPLKNTTYDTILEAVKKMAQQSQSFMVNCFYDSYVGDAKRDVDNESDPFRWEYYDRAQMYTSQCGYQQTKRRVINPRDSIVVHRKESSDSTGVRKQRTLSFLEMSQNQMRTTPRMLKKSRESMVMDETVPRNTHAQLKKTTSTPVLIQVPTVFGASNVRLALSQSQGRRSVEGKYKVGTDHTAWNLAYAQDIARQVGLGEGEISESAVHHLMSNVTQVVRDVLMTATHYCTHGRRTKVEVLDLENAINVLRPLFSFTCSRAASNTQFISDVLTRSLYENNRYVVDLRSIMNMPPRRMPFKRKIRKHWLVIDGEQPRVPENPVIPLLTSNSTQEGLTTYQNSSTDPLIETPEFVREPEFQDQQVFFKKCVETVMGSCSEKRRLNDIIPALCSCVVCREFSADPEDKRHFRLREFAGMILSSICKRTHLADVRARVTTFLCRVFTDSRANLGSLYGALYALGELGCEIPRNSARIMRLTVFNTFVVSSGLLVLTLLRLYVLISMRTQVALLAQQHGLAGLPLTRDLAFRQVTCEDPSQCAYEDWRMASECNHLGLLGLVIGEASAGFANAFPILYSFDLYCCFSLFKIFFYRLSALFRKLGPAFLLFAKNKILHEGDGGLITCKILGQQRHRLGKLPIYYDVVYFVVVLSIRRLPRPALTTVAVVVFPRLELLRRRIAILSDSPPTALGDSEKVIRLIEKMLTRFVMRRKMSGLSELCDFQKAFPGFGEVVYNKLKTSGHLQDVVPSVDDVCQSSSTDSGFVATSSKTQNTPQKQNPRILQLPLRVPGQIRPTNVSAAKLPTFKSNKRHAGGGLFRQAPPTSAPRVTIILEIMLLFKQSTSETVQPIGGSQTLQQHPNIIPQNSRGPSTNPTGPLPAVVVEPAFPRRRPHTLGEQARTHPAVTVEPAYPRRPGQPGAL
uniref:TAF6_C domain-containing protein n=1 Tax=Angiostrongylus cantonensis TaxID=6313 RepID=A0A158PBI4_ANGCA